MRRVALVTLLLAASVAAWQGVASLDSVDDLTLASPVEVIDAFGDDGDLLFDEAWVTLYEVLLGLGIAVVLGLLATRESGPDGTPDAVAGALAKINRVLPSTLRRQVEALEDTLDFTASTGSAAPAASLVLMLADAIRRRRRLHTAYRSFSGEESERELSPYGLVVHSGSWYIVAHDHKRDDLRTFRVDRMWRAALADGAFVPPPDGFDAVAHLTHSLASLPWRWQIEVLLDLPVDEALRRIPTTLAELADDPGGTLLRMRVNSLDWMATVLAGLGCSFTILRPDELRGSVRALADRLAAQSSAARG